MSGRGGTADPRLDPTHPKVFTYDLLGTYPNQISLAVEPLGHADRLALANSAGPAMPFARFYADSLAPGRRVLLVPVAYGGTGFSAAGALSWNSAGTGNLFTQAVAQANAAMAAAGPGAKFAGIIWLQGEADTGAGVGGPAYQAYIEAAIAAFRAQITGAGPTTPFVMGQMVPEFIAGATTRQVIDGVHQVTPGRVTYTGFAPGIANAQNGDNLHYNGPGQRAMGKSMWLAFADAKANTALVARTPGQIAIVNAAAGNALAVLTWDQPTPGSALITDYLVEYKLASGSTWTTFADGTSSATGATITGLTNLSAYNFRVSAINSIGAGPTSPVATTTPHLPSVADSVTNFSVSPNNTVANLSWSTPYDGGAAITDYTVQYRTTVGPGSWLTFSDGTSTATTAQVTGLTNNTSYDFRVAAVNSVGTAAYPTPVTAIPTSVFFADDFTRADTASSMGTTSTGAKLWTSLSGTWGILGNQAYCSAGAAATNSAAVVDALSADGTLSVTLATDGTPANSAGVVFRATDDNNYWLFTSSNALFKRVSGSFVSMASGSATSAPGDIFSVVMSGNSILCKKNGTTIAAVTDAFNVTATKHGLRSYNNQTGVHYSAASMVP